MYFFITKGPRYASLTGQTGNGSTYDKGKKAPRGRNMNFTPRYPITYWSTTVHVSVPEWGDKLLYFAQICFQNTVSDVKCQPLGS